MSYCESALEHPLHTLYHDTAYGFPLVDDAGLFERFVLEINQAGLSWLLMLKKQAAFRQAFAGFDLATVAAFGPDDEARLMADASIIRNRRKIQAVIENARRLVTHREQFGSFAGWLDAHHPLPLAEWQRLFKRTFVFTGGEIVREFLWSTGYLPGAHHPACPIYPKILAANPPWLRAGLSSDVVSNM